MRKGKGKKVKKAKDGKVNAHGRKKAGKGYPEPTHGIVKWN